MTVQYKYVYSVNRHGTKVKSNKSNTASKHIYCKYNISIHSSFNAHLNMILLIQMMIYSKRNFFTLAKYSEPFMSAEFGGCNGLNVCVINHPASLSHRSKGLDRVEAGSGLQLTPAISMQEQDHQRFRQALRHDFSLDGMEDGGEVSPSWVF